MKAESSAHRAGRSPSCGRELARYAQFGGFGVRHSGSLSGELDVPDHATRKAVAKTRHRRVRPRALAVAVERTAAVFDHEEYSADRSRDRELRNSFAPSLAPRACHLADCAARRRIRTGVMCQLFCRREAPHASLRFCSGATDCQFTPLSNGVVAPCQRMSQPGRGSSGIVFGSPVKVGPSLR